MTGRGQCSLVTAIVCTNSGLVHSGCHARWWRKCRHCVYEQRLGAFRMSCQVVEEVSPLCLRTAAWCIQDVMPGGGGSVAIVFTNSSLVRSGCHARWWRKCRHCVYEQRLGAFRMSCQVVEEVSPLCVRTAAWCVQDVLPGGGGSVVVLRDLWAERTPLAIVNGNMTVQHYINDILCLTVLPYFQLLACGVISIQPELYKTLLKPSMLCCCGKRVYQTCPQQNTCGMSWNTMFDNIHTLQPSNKN